MLILGLVDVPLWLLLLLFIFATLLIYGSWNFNAFKSQGLTGPTPYPFIGAMLSYFRKGFAKFDMELKKHGKVAVIFTGRNPELVVFDEEMLSQIMVKEFTSFTNRRSFSFDDETLSTMVTVIKDDHWKHVRNQMTPAFSTGKLKKMMSEINRCGQQLACNLAQTAKTGKEFDMRECSGAFTMDVISSTAFGIRVDSQNDKDNVFITKARKAMNFSERNPLLLVLFMFPWIAPYLGKIGITFISKDAVDFFSEVTKKAMEIRKGSDDQSRSDFLQLMIKAQQEQTSMEEDSQHGNQEDKSKQKGLTLNEILGNAFIFFLAGFDSTSISLTMLLYNLAIHQDIQDKLHDEINTFCTKEGPIDYDTLSKMTYLDQCVCESLRLYPLALRVDRVASHDVTIGGIRIPKDTVVNIPIYAIHHSPENWPQPEKFDPERFAPEKKGQQNPYHWMPFGFGPRNCIAMRLALVEMKVAVAYVLRKQRVMRSESTEVPFEVDKMQLLKSGRKVFMKIEKRK